MNDFDIISGLIDRNDYVTRFFINKYRPLFICIIHLVFDYKVDEDECINDLYYYLMKNNAEKLKSFKGKSTFGCWIKKVAIRHFRDLRNSRKVIDNRSKEPPYEKNSNDEDKTIDTITASEAKEDLERLFKLMKNQRYIMVIRALVLEDREPEHLAKFMGVTVDNLYNIKKRALAALVKTAINDKKKYGKKE